MENLGTENQGFARGISNSVGGWGNGGGSKASTRFSNTAFLPHLPPASPLAAAGLRLGLFYV
jgi:hypothetical protein